MSSSNTSQQKTNIRPTDPNVLQRIASHPTSSVWVGASAGSGKTKVLTDRILRLLLPNSQGQAGTPPHKILALTFTKAAASEMALRISEKLSEWAVMPLKSEDNKQKGLIENLKSLLGQDATEEQITAARKLFAAVIDTPGGLKIMTIHSFCQSVLSRFPLEADLSPSFKALDEGQAQRLLKQARDKVLKNSEIDKGSPLAQAIHNIATAQNEDQFTDLLKSLIKERHQFNKILESNFGIDGLYTALCQQFDIPAGKSADALLLASCDSANFDETGLWEACKTLGQSDKNTDQKKSIGIQNWLEASKIERLQLYSSYKSVFLTQHNDIRKKLVTKQVANNNPDSLAVLESEAQRLFHLEKDFQAIHISTLTRDLFLIGEEILTHYDDLKDNENSLDFDDLILRTLNLLQGRTENMHGLKVGPWVQYKLDQGIDHILVDEAQDTNPEQWEIIKALCDDFFDGSMEGDIERTIFVVGDEKQSIFSFQRASPEKFQQMRGWFSDKILTTGKRLEPVSFITSFRSAQAVLQLVDNVFSSPETRKGLGLDDIKHESYYYKRAGQVELWPLFENPEKQDFDPWAPPIEISDSTSGAAQLANHIALTIAGWINKKEPLESYNRPIEAGDILILVRSRTAFLDQIVRALKEKNIPVSGVDRMVLSQQLVVQDLCAAAQFALLPEDDLNLAGLLKSPFIGWNEEKLFKASYNRKESLWARIKKSADNQTIKWLSGLIEGAGKDRPYEFFAKILQESCLADNQSGMKAIKNRLGEECLDPLDEFLNRAIEFEGDSIPTLQNFLQTQMHDESEIKRQMEEGRKAVRIMTVHGAKGLQAPIVILPDTVKSSQGGKIERILWPDRSGANLPYFCPQSKEIPDPCHQALEVLKTRQEEESRRLLYVALTRAENRLYVGGYKTTKKTPDDSWYKYVEQGFSNLPDVEEIDFGDKKILQFKNHSPDNAHDRGSKNKNPKSKNNDAPPAWLYEPMPEEPFPPRPLTPSRPSEKDVAALSPLKSKNDHRFLRGNITHKLLQILPDLAPDKREQAAKNYVALPSHNLSEKIQESIVSETIKILNDPNFSAIFGEGSIAEVPITGLLNNKTLISGQIDRLLVTDNEILVVDYKTNRPPPTDVKDVPIIYHNQMKAYADALRLIYKDRPIRTALIWTDGVKLMELPTDF